MNWRVAAKTKGKAQKAMLGVKGLAGMNTASFDPASTLIRPQMRVLSLALLLWCLYIMR